MAQLRAPKPAPSRWARLEAVERQFLSITKEIIELAKAEGEGPDWDQTREVLRQMRKHLYVVEIDI